MRGNDHQTFVVTDASIVSPLSEDDVVSMYPVQVLMNPQHKCLSNAQWRVV